MSIELYYTAPSDSSFEDMKQCAIDLWQTRYGDSGNYVKEKLDRIRDIKNIDDNFMYIFAMFDMSNQLLLCKRLQTRTLLDIVERIN